MATAQLAPPPGFVEDYPAPPPGFVLDGPPPPHGFVEDSPRSISPETLAASRPSGVTIGGVGGLVAGFAPPDKPSAEVALPQGLTLEQLEIAANEGGAVTIAPDGTASIQTVSGRGMTPEQLRERARSGEIPLPSNLAPGTTDQANVTGYEGAGAPPELRESSALRNVPRPEGVGFIAGAGRGAINLADALTTPSNLALMAGLGTAPEAVARAASTAFGAMGAKALGEEIPALLDAKTPAEVGEHLVGALGAGAMAVGGFAHATADLPTKALATAATAPLETGSKAIDAAVKDLLKPNVQEAKTESAPAVPPSQERVLVPAAEAVADTNVPRTTEAAPAETPLQTAQPGVSPPGDAAPAGPVGEVSRDRVGPTTGELPIKTDSGVTEPPATPAPTAPAESAPPVARQELPEPASSRVASEEGTAADWTTATLESPKAESPPAEAAPKPVGILLPGMADMLKSAGLAKAAVQKVVGAIRDIPAFHDFRRSALAWSARGQKSSFEIYKAAKDVTTAINDPVRREGITNYIQANGDVSLLQARAKATPNLKLRKGYEAAASLTPEEIAVAQKVRAAYDTLLKRAQSYGINISELDNYVTQIWKRNPIKDFVASSSRKLNGGVRFAKQRFYDNYFEGEQNGLRPQTKDIAKLLPTYMNEVNNAINSRMFVEELSKGKAADGRPLLAPRGGGQTIDTPTGDHVHLVFPEKATADTADFKVVEQPALHDWKWTGSDEAGNPILVKSDLAVHPDHVSHLKNVLGNSALREWWNSPSESPLASLPKAAVKFLVEDVQQIGKATMLGFLSPFHQVQEGTHALGHRVNPFSGIPKIDLNDPKQIDATRHGLMLAPDRISAKQFTEGLDGSNRNIAANVIGQLGKAGAKVKEWTDGYQHYLFHEYIPGLKLKTYEHILDRNMKRYVDELASGDVTQSQIKYLSAQQSNAAYGHLNYADMGRNPTIQHLAQIFLLAPDFLEARGRFTGQAARAPISKVGREQLAAIATLAATQYVAARALNQTLDGDPHNDHPFDVIVGGRRYTMRSVPEDIYKAFEDTRKFASGRLSPLVGRGLMEGLSGVNYRGEPTSAAESLTNIIAGMVPLTLQPLTRGLSETGKDNPVSPIEQLIGSLGLHVSRFSPVSEIYHLSKEWTEKHGKEYGLDQRRAVFPVSKYQQLRYALEDSDIDRAKSEIEELVKSEKISRAELSSRFKMSINHPFTGTRETDAIFRKSLDARGQKVFDAAVKRRAVLIDRFDHTR